jgi:hypothetical protein
LGYTEKPCFKNKSGAGCHWLTPVTLTNQEAANRRITVQSQPRQMVYKILSQKNLSQKRAGEVAQGVDPKLKLQDS